MGTIFSRFLARNRENTRPEPNPRNPLLTYIESGYLEPEWVERAQFQDSSDPPPNGVFLIKCWTDIERQRRLMRLWGFEEDIHFNKALEMERKWMKIFRVTILFFVILYSVYVYFS